MREGGQQSITMLGGLVLRYDSKLHHNSVVNSFLPSNRLWDGLPESCLAVPLGG